MQKIAVIAAATLFLTGTPVFSQDLTATIIKVTDGDTIGVRDRQGKVIKVRLGCIDAPELSQRPWGQQSTERLKQLLPVGQSVRLREIDKDKYGRMVAEVYVGNRSINLKMVEEGMAVVYRQYLQGCSANQNQFLQSEANAKTQNLAFWHQINPIMPQIARKSQVRTPREQSQQKCDPHYPDLCLPLNSPDLNCSDIPYRRFRVLSPDPHGFDRNKDGIGCES